MKNPKLSWRICFIYSLIGIFLPLLISVVGIKNRLDVSQPFQDTFVNLPGEGILEQTFVANHDFVNIVILSLKNPGLANKGEFLFSLQTEEGQPLVERTFSGYNIEDPCSIRFQFDPLTSSKNKKLKILIRSLTSTEPSIGVGASRKDGLSYSVYYKTVDKKSAVLELVSSLTKRFWADKVFFIFWLFLLSFFGVVVIRMLKKRE